MINSRRCAFCLYSESKAIKISKNQVKNISCIYKNEMVSLKISESPSILTLSILLLSFHFFNIFEYSSPEPLLGRKPTIPCIACRKCCDFVNVDDTAPSEPNHVQPLPVIP